MTIMAIACAYLGDYELAEVVLTSVCVEAVRFEGPDAELSLHAQHNLDCLRKVKAAHNERSTMQLDGSSPSGVECADQKSTPKSSLQELSTDRHVIYLRFDLAMGLFETLGQVEEQIRTRSKRQSFSTSGLSSFGDVTPLTAQLAAAACLIQ